MKHKQRGMTLIGFVIVLAVAGLFIYVGMKLVPMYTEFYAVKKALASLESEPGLVDKGPQKIQELFFKRLNMSYALNVKRDHLKIERAETGYKLTVDYENRREMIANLDVVAKFHAEKVIQRRAGE
ncbi:DUF4845 domain-containing protein [Agrilutibacter solisilvae]|uniref:DUF4845 domain-containing protein n=1 Tax=Agrilutibacter solisilvae TaxID=2763317 RepID=A0A974XYZ6_9GAMM|nr:DUF4845 domain-containing protein [Lysobacter solisilvae]QSX78238.1 DUF4845 domain-containing protein [Lysobacter solisilvae]